MVALERRVKRLENVVVGQRQELQTLQSKRLFFGLSAFCLFILSQIIKGLYFEFIALFVAIPIFIYFFRKSRAKLHFILKLESLIHFYDHQIRFQTGESFEKPDIEEFPEENLVRDLDLHEFFPTIDMTISLEGSHLLKSWLCQVFKNSSFAERQSHVKDIVKYPGLVRKIFSQRPEEKINFSVIQKEVNRSFFEHNPSWKWLIPISWLSLIACLFLPLPGLIWKSLLLIYLATSLFYMGATQALFSRLQDLLTEVNKLHPYMKDLSKLSKVLSFTPSLKKGLPEKNVKELRFLIALVSIKSNPILFYLLNIIAPWNFLLTEKCEKARKKMSEDLESWSKEIILLETLSSLSTLKTYQPTTWAQSSSNESLICENLAHPLIDQKSVVTNNFSQDSSKRVFIITGSNMSGKSTFLRALGMNFCLAKIGAPVFATRFEFPNVDIASCIRVSDSLRDGQSYFYAEVRRMKDLLDKAQAQPILFLIDEPLRGTNNKERLAGNQSYLKQILKTKSLGFASTHDLELTQLSDISDEVTNYHFSDEWQDGELYFNYKIQDGPSQTTNALKILEKEGLY
ncbi:MAG: hypothetical protein HRT44_01175 [Bdellovibrionales bacterium]|nr:hypothetical protein [Bdellovibrionales bacterium]NQZ17860.1 hypothetical protein [Bdellovibrionales bacterium]